MIQSLVPGSGYADIYYHIRCGDLEGAQTRAQEIPDESKHGSKI